MKNSFYIEIENYQQYGLKEKSYLACNQLRVISKERLIKDLKKRKINGQINHFKIFEYKELVKLKEFLCKKVIKKEDKKSP